MGDFTTYPNRVFSWDGSKLQHFFVNYVLIWLNNIMSWTSQQVARARANIGGDVDVSVLFPTSGVDSGNTYTLEGAIAVIPDAWQRGGMTIRFVSTSDNKYVQYRCIADEFTTDTTQWAIAEKGVYVENPEFVYVKTDAEGKILWAIRTDGDIFYGVGVPSQVINYINERIAELSLDEYEDIVTFLANLEKGDKTLQTLLNEKVDKEEGKSLIDAEYANGVHYIENPEFAGVWLDGEDKILFGIKVDGETYFGAGCPQQVKDYIEEKISSLSLDEYEDIVAFLSDYLGLDTTLKVMIDGINATKLDKEGLDPDALATVQAVDNPEYIQVETDDEDKILGGRKADGTKFENMPIETPTVNVEHIEHPEWIDIKTDNKGKVLEGINVNGEKHISKLDSETEDMIKEFVGNSNTVPNVINIPLFDANFTSPVPVTITGTKGDENAKYEFKLPLNEAAFDIRFKFKITENLLNQNKSCTIGRLDNAIINALVTTLVQYRKTGTVGGVSTNIYYPTLSGGIRYMNNNLYNYYFDSPLAFSIKYTGTSTNVKVANNGQKFILKVDDISTEFTLSNYDSVYELYNAIKNTTDFEVSYKELVGHTCDELAVFPECSLINTYYAATSSETYDGEVYENASAPFFVPYAKDNQWHQVEIVKQGDYLYTSVDGYRFEQTSYNNGKVLTLGGNCGVLFKDLVVYADSCYDAEISGDYIVSSVSPCLVIFEGHGMFDKPADEFVVNPPSIYTQEAMGVSVDRLYDVFRYAIDKGYIPVTIEDVVKYFDREKTLPKRCFTIIFDDFRYNNCLDLKNRKVFTELGISPSLAIIYSSTDTITFDGSTITKKEASEICLRNNFQLLNHLDHTATTVTNPAILLSKLSNDIIQADKILVDGMTIVYPNGWADQYVYNTLKWMGIKLGISVVSGPYNNPLSQNRYNLRRVEIGARVSLDSIIEKIH